MPVLKAVTGVGCERQVYRGRVFLLEIIKKGFVEEVAFTVILEGRIAFRSGRLGRVGRETVCKQDLVMGRPESVQGGHSLKYIGKKSFIHGK